MTKSVILTAGKLVELLSKIKPNVPVYITDLDQSGEAAVCDVTYWGDSKKKIINQVTLVGHFSFGAKDDEEDEGTAPLTDAIRAALEATARSATVCSVTEFEEDQPNVDCMSTHEYPFLRSA